MFGAEDVNPSRTIDRLVVLFWEKFSDSSFLNVTANNFWVVDKTFEAVILGLGIEKIINILINSEKSR